MNRIGETVVVPIGCSLTRCGISEPVMKIARSSTFCFRSKVWLIVGSASAVPATILAARVVMLEDIRTFTNKLHPGRYGVQTIEAMTMAHSWPKQERQ